MSRQNNNLSLRRSRQVPRKGKKQGDRIRSVTSIPPYRAQTTRKVHLRYYTSNADAINDGLTLNQLGAMIGFVAQTAILGNYITSGFRIDMVEMWATPPAIGDTVTIAAKWADNPTATSVGIANPPVTIMDSSGNVDRYAHFRLLPRKGSYADNFLASNGTVTVIYFSLNSTAGNATATIDFHMSFYLDDIGTTSSFAIAAATAGTMYHRIVTGSAGLVYTPVPPLNGL